MNIIPFNFFKHFIICSNLLINQWNLNVAKYPNKFFYGLLYLLEILSITRELYVATKNDTIIGMCGFSNKTKCIWIYKFMYWILLISLYPFQNTIIKYYKECHIYFNEINNFDGELTIIIVDKNYKSYGIGTNLFDYVCDRMRSIGYKSFIISTYDAYCDTYFYSRRNCDLYKNITYTSFDGTQELLSLYVKKLE